MAKTNVAFQGTLQLLDWNDGKRGRKVVFEIMDDEDTAELEHPFKQFTARNGKIAGQLFAAVLVHIDPATGEPVEEPKKKSWAEMTPSQKAYIICRNPTFWEWACETAGTREVYDEETARAFMLDRTDSSSRSHYDHDQLKRIKFLELVTDFDAWSKEHNRATIGGK